MKEDFKIAARFSDLYSAEITAGMLQANGIAAQVFNENTTFSGFLDRQGIVVKVNASDYEEALSLLAAQDKAE